ncbi:guanitoxin biosynthesis MATE family efflux transporter GntT [Trichocoleus sp. FACHB-591]|uniref:guanitoxin biosynthesis MATE family efflux transporter GntT n=1 Tax=Trichocoleus sp. FACHB-591 TaxID=2692872 RepID=UPI0018F04F26|nr:guanitoxin biosynthesis MATE family efflux transporter GntT [Trichocoleus sp. FACHB-591]
MSTNLSTTDFLRRFSRLAIVNILSNLMVPLAGLVDVAFLGHLAEIRHLAGVALATVLFNYLYWTFGFLRMGTTGMTAQAIGRGDRDSALLVGLRHGLVALGIGLVILLLQLPLRAIGFTLLSATAEVKLAGQDYYNALIWGAPATLINFVLIGWFLGREQSGKVLLLSAISNLTNSFMDYFFVVRWGWESAGAGYSTALSQYLMLFTGMWLVCREFRWSQIQAIASKIWEPIALKAAFTLNREILIRTFVLISTFAVFTNLSSTFGTNVLATNTVLLQVVTLAAYFIDGLAFATESLAGIFRGQGTNEQLRLLLWISGGTSFVFGLGFAIAFILNPDLFFGLLTNHRDVLERINQYVVWLLPVLASGSIAYMLDGYFIGLTEGKILRQSVVVASVVGFAPVAIAAWYFQNSHLLWLALALFMVVRAVMLGQQVPASLRSVEKLKGC